jgi:DNA-nicking Smr family endonuclease
MKRRNKNSATTSTSDDDEKALFQDAMRDVAPLTGSDKVVQTHKPTELVPRQIRQSEVPISEDSLSDHVSLEVAAGDEWSFLRPGMSRQVLRRLRRGYWGIQTQLDLHGFTRDEARFELVTFLDTCTHNGFRCVRVIHGKGLSSKNREPVLKVRVGNWLAQRDDVLAFCQATPKDGGSGALLVLLKTSTR